MKRPDGAAHWPERAALGLFCVLLLGSLAAGVNLLYALGAGLLVFLACGLLRGHTPKALLRMCWDGVKTAGGVLTVFVLVGMLTGVWRASGTIAVIVCYAVNVMRPEVFILLTFLLNALVSFLIGTSFGTAATMGVVCVTMANAMGVNIFWAGGAMLSGVYFGDRCSAVSTSAMLVAAITKTDIFGNLREMLKTALVPFLLACAVYLLAGLRGAADGTPQVRELFESVYTVHWLCLLPAVLVLALSLARVKVKIALAAGIAAALPLCILLQGQTLPQVLRVLLLGYSAADPQVAAMMDGGGIVSMFRVAMIVGLASCYAGIFRGTGMLDELQHVVNFIGRRVSPFAAVLCASLVSGVFACNQTLTIMLTDQLCVGLDMTARERALALENSAVVIAAVIPWSIAGAVPLDTVGAPLVCMAGACYLYFIPLWQLAVSLVRKGREKPADA